MHPSSSPTSIADAQRPLFVGADVGGTNIKLGLVDDTGRTVAYCSLPTRQELGAEDACRRMSQAVAQMLANVGVKNGEVARAGIATPGPLDISRGIILRPGNVPGWWDFPIRDRFGHHLNLPVTVANDANAACYGEFWRGTGEKFQSIVLLTLGTGVGGGIIIGDTLIEGEHSCGGECGHIIVDPCANARKDSLGSSGSLEACANAAAVVDRANAALDAGQRSSLENRRAGGEPITPRMVAEEAERGDGVARDVIMETAHYLAIGIVTFIHTIDPDAVVLGGAMNFGGPTSAVGRDFIERIRDEVRPRILEPLRDKIHIEFASLGGDAGYIGAAGLARLEHRKLGQQVRQPMFASRKRRSHGGLPIR
jgi:glucokinase